VVGAGRPHLLKKQLLDPHWEKKVAEVNALERATLYGIVVYSGRRSQLQPC
jgi:ATP-dependent helicase HrpA